MAHVYAGSPGCSNDGMGHRSAFKFRLVTGLLRVAPANSGVSCCFGPTCKYRWIYFRIVAARFGDGTVICALCRVGRIRGCTERGDLSPKQICLKSAMPTLGSKNVLAMRHFCPEQGT